MFKTAICTTAGKPAQTVTKEHLEALMRRKFDSDSVDLFLLHLDATGKNGFNINGTQVNVVVVKEGLTPAA